MNLTVNGEQRQVDAGTTLRVLVVDVAGRVEGTAAAVNGELVPRSAWARTVLDSEDRVELLTARPGG